MTESLLANQLRDQIKKLKKMAHDVDEINEMVEKMMAAAHKNIDSKIITTRKNIDDADDGSYYQGLVDGQMMMLQVFKQELEE